MNPKLLLALAPNNAPVFRWNEPGTWPWFVFVWLGFMALGWSRPLWSWLRTQQAKSWPVASGRIDTIAIEETKRFLGLTLQSQQQRGFPVVVEYSYAISGNVFHGQYKQAFGSEDDANEFMRGLEGQTVPVQYHPNKTGHSMILEENMAAVLAGRPPAPPNPILDAKKTLPQWAGPFVALCALLSFAGLILSLWVHIGALLGKKVAPEYAFFLLHVGIFVVWFPAILVMKKRIGSTQGKDYWMKAFQGSPDGLRYMVYFFFAYAFVNFAVFMVNAPAGKSTGETPVNVWRGFSGHWMLFYSVALATFLSAMNASKPGGATGQQ